jgi:hypothetical protein
LTDWLTNTMLAQGKISKGDMDLLLLTDSVAQAHDYITRSVRDASWRTLQEEEARKETRSVLSKRD